jgi:hypothetical protein
MGGKPQQVNSAQASQANAGAQAASQAEANLSNQNASEQKLMFNNLFGADGKSGSMGQFMDPKSMNVTQPTGAYATEYKNATNQAAQGYANQRGALSRAWGGTSGSMLPNGFQAQQQNQLSRSQADNKGAMFSDYTDRAHQDAVQNFWNANNIASGQAASSGQTAQAAGASAGNIEDGIYGTAGKQAQGSGFFNSLLGAAGMVGNGAMQRKW